MTQTIEQLRVELAQARDELAQTQIDKELAQQGHLIASQEAVDLRAARNALAKGRDRNLVQARAELKDLQGANRALGQQVARVRRNRDFWYNTCLGAEKERNERRQAAQEQSDLVQREWLSPCQKAGLEALVETLRRQLTDARRVARLWFRRAHEPMVEVEITGKEMVEALQDERALRQVAETSERATRKMLARQCDMARTAETEAMKAKRELAEAELAAHVHDKACGELAQTVRTERADRRKAERRLEAVSGMARDRGSRLRIAKQRAERAEAANDHLRSVASQVPYYKDRHEQVKQRAEALAALVTEELAELLERLAAGARVLASRCPIAERGLASLWRGDAETGLALAASIREAMALEGGDGD